jgi:hypothetical protein
MGAKNLIVHPVSTVKGLPGGVARYFTGLFHRAKKGSHEATESMSNEDAEGGTGQGDDEKEEAGDQNLEKQTKNIIGYEKARRQLAWRLGVDPYSTNLRLQEELDRLAWASFAGGFAARSIPRVPGLSEAAMISEQVWTLPPEQIERRNGKKLKKMGVAKELYWELFYNERYSITVQTMLVDALKRLKGVEGRPGFVELAVQAQSDVEARFMTGLARILADRHERVGKLRALSTEGGLVLGLTRDGEIVLPVAVDILYWTEELEQAVSGSRLHAGEPEIWVSGHVTSRARSELADRGWVVHERCHGGAKPAAVVAEVPARHGD